MLIYYSWKTFLLKEKTLLHSIFYLTQSIRNLFVTVVCLLRWNCQSSEQCTMKLRKCYEVWGTQLRKTWHKRRHQNKKSCDLLLKYILKRRISLLILNTWFKGYSLVSWSQNNTLCFVVAYSLAPFTYLHVVCYTLSPTHQFWFNIWVYDTQMATWQLARFRLNSRLMLQMTFTVLL